MTGSLEPGGIVLATDFALEPADLAADQIVAGAPRVREATLVERDGVEIGVWELSPGTVTDVEVDEVSVVIAGDATLEILDDGGGRTTHELRPGTVFRLEAGMRTIWTVRETLRKVYVVRLTFPDCGRRLVPMLWFARNVRQKVDESG